MDKKQKPLFWYWPCSDGTYEGPIHDSSIEEVRKQSGAWKPLFDHPGGATDMVAEIERLRPLADEVQAARHVMREHNRLLSELAASQDREEQLRGSIIRFRSERALKRAGSILATEGYAAMEYAAIDAPQDTSALEALIARAGEVMRERCAKHVEAQYDFSKPMAAAIRALPGVKLEDLQK